MKHNVSLVSTAAGADVQVIDGNSDGSDSTGTAGGETTQQTESQTPESTTPSTEPAYPAETESEPETEEETEDSPLAKRQRRTRNWIIRRNTIKEAERKRSVCVSLQRRSRGFGIFHEQNPWIQYRWQFQKEGGVNKETEKAAMQFCRSEGEILWRADISNP